MKKKFANISVLFFALTFGFGLSACNNDDNHNNLTEKHGAGGPMTTIEGKRIKSIQTGDETLSFTYDAQGRIVKMTERDHDDLDVTTYEYSGNTIVASEYGDNGKVDDVIEYTVSNGLITKSKERGFDSDKKTYKYQDNRLVEYAQDRAEKDLYTWNEGNITLLRETDDDDADELTSYTYSIDISNNKLELMIITDCDPVLVLQGYMGQGTANQLSSISEGAETTSCSYTRDADGNIISIAFARPGRSTKTMNITWE